jgi:Zn/Cd-binding protein ZinT
VIQANITTRKQQNLKKKNHTEESKDRRYWFNSLTEETISCELHYECRKVQDIISESGKMNFYRNGWCRIACYTQQGRKVGVVEGYSMKNIKKGVDFLLSKHKIDTLMTEKHDTNGYDIRIQDIGGYIDGIQ